MTAAATLRWARRRAGLSARGLAARAGTSHATLLAYEAGTKIPRVDTLDRIVRAAGFALDLGLDRRPDAGDRTSRGRELADALDLAAQFPARHESTLRYPPFDALVRLPEKIVAIHRSLDVAGVPHVFGGALALAWCTQQARGTIDIDINLFVPPEEAPIALAGLPQEVRWSDTDVAAIDRDGQVRLWWDTTPVDVFFSTAAFHDEAATRARREPFLGEELPFLSCRDLAVFKAFFDRTRDWADLEEMAGAGALDVEAVLGVLVHRLGGDDHRVERLRALA